MGKSKNPSQKRRDEARMSLYIRVKDLEKQNQQLQDQLTSERQISSAKYQKELDAETQRLEQRAAEVKACREEEKKVMMGLVSQLKNEVADHEETIRLIKAEKATLLGKIGKLEKDRKVVNATWEQRNMQFTLAMKTDFESLSMARSEA